MPADYSQYDYITKRVRYFDTQFLKDQDFIDEQKYHIDRQRRPLRCLHISGIVEGLTVAPGDGNQPDAKFQAAIAPGTAIDQNGCQIVLPPTKPPEIVALRDYANQTVEIFISYQELESDKAQQGGAAYRRWQEKPLVTVVKSGGTAPEAGIRLARLNVSSDGLVTVNYDDPSVRQYAGLRLPSSDGYRLTLRSSGDGASNLAVMTGSLSIDEKIGIGTPFPKDKLSIQGGALSFSKDNVPQVGIDYDSTTDTLRVRGNRNAQSLDTNLLSISRTTGAVSIGTTSASGGLEINRGNTNDLALSLNSSGAGWGSGLQFRNTATNARTYGIYSGNDGKWHFTDVNNSSDRLVIDKDGNIGIGTTSPSARLEISGTSGTLLSVGAMTINSQGKVGIGEHARLEISGTSGTVFSAGAASGSTANIALCGNINLREFGGTGVAYIQAKDQDSDRNIGLQFITQKGRGSLTEAMTINSQGNVGIGTSNPRSKLQVSGGNLAIDYGEAGYVLVDPATDWPNGTHRLIGVEWLNNMDTVKLYTPGSQRKDPMMTLESNGNITMGTSGSTASIGLTGHVLLKEYGGDNFAYLQARDDRSYRKIGLRLRTQTTAGARNARGELIPTITEAMTINADGSVDIAQKPIEIIKYSNLRSQASSDTPSNKEYVDFKTTYTKEHWVCSIAGFVSGSGDIERERGEIIRVVTYPNSDGFWHIQAGFLTHDRDERWDVWLMAIRKGFAREVNAL